LQCSRRARGVRGEGSIGGSGRRADRAQRPVAVRRPLATHAWPPHATTVARAARAQATRPLTAALVSVFPMVSPTDSRRTPLGCLHNAYVGACVSTPLRAHAHCPPPVPERVAAESDHRLSGRARPAWPARAGTGTRGKDAVWRAVWARAGKPLQLRATYRDYPRPRHQDQVNVQATGGQPPPVPDCIAADGLWACICGGPRRRSQPCCAMHGPVHVLMGAEHQARRGHTRDRLGGLPAPNNQNTIHS
jgi:hypothetical protein